MSIRKVLSPLLMISYVCGLRVIEFPIGVPRQWSGLLYMLLLWSLYNFVFIYGVIPYTIDYSILYHIWIGVNMFIVLLSIITGMYYGKEFRNCIKSLTIVDDTLEKLGIITDCKLYRRTIWFILGWFMLAIFIICMEIIYYSWRSHEDIVPTIYVPFMRIYCIHITVISDLIITSILGYIGLKFDQINKHLEKLTNGNKCRKNLALEHSVLSFHQPKYAKAKSSIIWIVMHLHLELRKISRKIDLMFGIQMTIEMGNYFTFIAIAIEELFNVIFNKNNKIFVYIYLIIILLWLFLHVFRLFLINYECESVSIKANTTRNFISKLSYSNCDIEIRENILQFLLMTQSPFRFYGLGLFQFGFKFLQGFTASVATVLVILLQANINENI